MMKDNISFTIPMDYNALTRTADMLNALAHDLESKKVPAAVPSNDVKKVDDDINKELDDAGNVFGKNVVPIDQNSIPIGVETASPPPPAPVPAESVVITPLTGVEIDSDGLPWDARIHGKNKLKLAKTQQWKKRRGVDPVLVADVEKELRATMAAPVATAAPIPPTPVTETPAPVPPAPPTGITFPELMAKITAAMAPNAPMPITEAMVTLACNNQGVASLALLAVRPDLIPAVNAELFPS